MTSTSPTTSKTPAKAPSAREGGAAAPRAITPGAWPTAIHDFRQDVHGDQLVGLIPVGDEKTPYPTGTPLAPEKKFWLKHGYYKGVAPV